MKKGTQTWLTGRLRNMSKIYDNETKVYDSLMYHAKRETKGSRVDLLEVFAGSANVTIRAWKHGLSALEPIDHQYNLDLGKAEDQKMLWQAVHKFRPLQILVAWPRTRWSQFNENLNYADRLEELEQLRDEIDRPLVKLGTDLMHFQHQSGKLFFGRKPSEITHLERTGRCRGF